MGRAMAAHGDKDALGALLVPAQPRIVLHELINTKNPFMVDEGYANELLSLSPWN